MVSFYVGKSSLLFLSGFLEHFIICLVSLEVYSAQVLHAYKQNK